MKNNKISELSPEYIISVDTEFSKTSDGITLLRIVIVAFNIPILMEMLNNQKDYKPEVHDYPMYIKDLHEENLSSFWDGKRKQQLVEYSGSATTYREICDEVHQKIRDLFQFYREIGKSSIKIIMGTTTDAELLKSLSPNGDIFYIKQENKPELRYSDPIIVRSLFSMYTRTELDNSYNAFYKQNKSKKLLRNKLHKKLFGSTTADAHNPQYDAILNAINFISICGYLC